MVERLKSPENTFRGRSPESSDRDSVGNDSFGESFVEQTFSKIAGVFSPKVKSDGISGNPIESIREHLEEITHVSTMPHELVKVLMCNHKILPQVDNMLSKISEPGSVRQNIEQLVGNFGFSNSEHTSPEDMQVLNKVFYNLLESKYGLGNTQFHTDSIESMMPRESYSTDKPERSRKGIEKTNEQIAQEPDGILAKQVVNARAEAAQQGLGENTDWIIGDRLPGLGILTHAGWQDAVFPKDGQTGELHAVRTLGLALGDRVVVGKVPLFLSVGRVVSESEAAQMLSLTAEAAFNSESKNWSDEQLSDWLNGQQDLDQEHRQLIFNFVRNSNEVIRSLHHQLG